ncbi:hypothetical protein CSW98_09455 [Vibrio sp. HA2012]|uniref:hypothetical protein n=1 Tax=Vibrio sp. HA2012 TaxID=1971595 RepID=UPI000C2B69EA|nr:hypothetical protein [Vibrio sp. HA2012]PJC86427.1 hypothetical protein CSW98_09455 [Vibrio sp. HA2012]
MHNLTPNTLKRYANQLSIAAQNKDWIQIQDLDLQLRPLLKQCQTISLSPAMKLELRFLKKSHRQAYETLSEAKAHLDNQLSNFSENKERHLAYEMTMNLE